MSDKTLAELIARKANESLCKHSPSYGFTEEPTAWANMSEQARGLRIASAGDVLEELGLLGLHVALTAQGTLNVTFGGQRVQTFETLPKATLPPATEKGKQEAHAVRKASGYTGNFCPECGSDRMVRNGSCEKCENCGGTSGCS